MPTAAHINPKLKRVYEKNNQFFLVVAVLILLVVGYFSYSSFSTLSTVKKDVKSLEKIETSLTAQLSSKEIEFTDQTETYFERRKEHQEELKRVFPLDPDVTDFVRLIDDYFFKHNFSSNEIFLKNMVFGKPQTHDEYMSVPVSMNITSSKNNFVNFLKYVENSGSLKSNVRMMDVQAIDVTFRENEDGKRVYDYRISAHLYFQNIEE